MLRRVNVLLLLATGGCVQGQSGNDPFAGTWSLTFWEARAPDGQAVLPLGDQPAGQLMYDGRGGMGVQVMRPDRPMFAVNDPLSGAPDEIQSAFEGFLAYYGRYTVQMNEGTITHHLVGSSFPNWVGTEQLRQFSFHGDTLVLRTPPVLAQGATAVHTLKWVRAR